MCIIRLFLSFVSVILFVCFNNNIFLWGRFSRSVLKILFVFLFPDCFQLPVDVSIQSVYFTGICVTWYACKLPNLTISYLKYVVILISVRIIFDAFFYYFNSFFNSISVFRKWISFLRFAINLLSTSVWCSSWLIISFCMRSYTSFFISFNKMPLIFCFLIFLDVLSKTCNGSENSVASGSVSLDMKELI